MRAAEIQLLMLVQGLEEVSAMVPTKMNETAEVYLNEPARGRDPPGEWIHPRGL